MESLSVYGEKRKLTRSLYLHFGKYRLVPSYGSRKFSGLIRLFSSFGAHPSCLPACLATPCRRPRGRRDLRSAPPRHLTRISHDDEAQSGKISRRAEPPCHREVRAKDDAESTVCNDNCAQDKAPPKVPATVRSGISDTRASRPHLLCVSLFADDKRN